MLAAYRIPAETRRLEVVIEKSRFIADLGHAPDVDAAKAFIQRVRGEFPDATHHCFAFVAGRPNDSRVGGASDDGEPGGTAGKPMLTVLSHSGLGEIVAVVTRYYGGIKLGTGGLARAYGGAVAEALKLLTTTEKLHYARRSLHCDYAQLSMVLHTLAECEGRSEQAVYGAQVALRLAIPTSRLEEFLTALRARSQDRLHCETLDD